MDRKLDAVLAVSKWEITLFGLLASARRRASKREMSKAKAPRVWMLQPGLKQGRYSLGPVKLNALHNDDGDCQRQATATLRPSTGVTGVTGVLGSLALGISFVEMLTRSRVRGI